MRFGTHLAPIGNSLVAVERPVGDALTVRPASNLFTSEPITIRQSLLDDSPASGVV